MENILRFKEYGEPNGKKLVYFHGAPGSPEECSIFEMCAKEHGLNIICFDRFSIDLNLKGEAYYKYIADAIIKEVEEERIDLIGFSIGCQAAIKTSFYLGGSVRKLHLVSAGAPLEGGDYLNKMAGKAVFSIAMKFPRVFTLLSYWQVLLAKAVPKLLYSMLFANTEGEDAVLVKTEGFKNYISPVLSSCFSHHVKGYIREIDQYVSPWKEAVIKCDTDIQLWHGESDNWSPLEMATYLHVNTAGKSELEIMPGLSHYSCLFNSVPRICEAIENSAG